MKIAPAAASRAPINRPIAVVDGVNTATPATYYVHTDHLHRPVKMSDASKVMQWSAEYQPWGAVQSLSGPLTMDLRFPGQWFQLEAGLHYNWHRHYDPSLGRYTQPDPLGFVDGPSVYGYAGGSPVSYSDPSGLVSVLIPQTKPPGGSNATQCGWESNICRWVLRWIPTGTPPTTVGKYVLVWVCGKLDDFWKDEQGARSPNQIANRQAHDALREAARERQIEITRELQREFHDDITGRNIEGYQRLLEAARDFLNHRLGP